jgi:hypothetical protein
MDLDKLFILILFQLILYYGTFPYGTLGKSRGFCHWDLAYMQITEKSGVRTHDLLDAKRERYHYATATGFAMVEQSKYLEE